MLDIKIEKRFNPTDIRQHWWSWSHETFQWLDESNYVLSDENQKGNTTREKEHWSFLWNFLKSNLMGLNSNTMKVKKNIACFSLSCSAFQSQRLGLDRRMKCNET